MVLNIRLNDSDIICKNAGASSEDNINIISKISEYGFID